MEIVRQPQCPRKGILKSRDQQQVNVIGHQAVGHDVQAVLPGVLPQARELILPVASREEHILSVRPSQPCLPSEALAKDGLLRRSRLVPALGHVVRRFNGNNASDPRHPAIALCIIASPLSSQK